MFLVETLGVDTQKCSPLKLGAYHQSPGQTFQSNGGLQALGRQTGLGHVRQLGKCIYYNFEAL